MKYRYLFAAFLVGCIMLTGCKKENPVEEQVPEDIIILKGEGFQSDEKTYVNGSTVQWNIGDVVNLNGTNCTVYYNPDLEFYYVHSNNYYFHYPLEAFYACSAINNSGGNQPTVAVPGYYTCRFDEAGNQIIALPMAAYYSLVGMGLYEIEFKHITAAVNVNVKNSMGSDIVVEKVVVSSDRNKLSGTTQLYFSDMNVITVNAQDASTNNSVTVDISGGLTVPAYSTDADIRTIQVPILPLDSPRELYVNVYAHKVSNPSETFNYSIYNIDWSASLARNAMISANCNIQESGIFNPYTTPLTFEAFGSSIGIKFTENNPVSLSYRILNQWNVEIEQGNYTTGENNVTISAGQRLEIYATEINTQMSTEKWPMNQNYFSFTQNGDVYVYGNIMSLLYPEFADKKAFPEGSEWTFSGLFTQRDIFSHPTKDLVLPATTLAPRCYYKLFYATSITRAPELPATQLANQCYTEMFYRCDYLNYIKCMATSNITGNTNDWVNSVQTTSGTFVKKIGATWQTGTSGIPTNWTVQTATN